MINFKKSAIALLFICHFSILTVYLINPEKIDVINLYVEPIFRQNWHMFAPNPLTFSSRLVVKCSDKDGWIDPTMGLLEKHSRLPLVHYQKSIFLFNSISQTLLDSRTTFKNETHCGNVSLKHCEKSFKDWIRPKDAFLKATHIGKQICGTTSLKIHLGVYIEHAKAYSTSLKIQNKGAEILELN
ncbi:MAG TPA: DUF5819 family protein [Bacteriovoracaceae bacterium]|nr:DUF5819 family protein [Bacteriovoracaceae bacterium]